MSWAAEIYDGDRTREREREEALVGQEKEKESDTVLYGSCVLGCRSSLHQCLYYKQANILNRMCLQKEYLTVQDLTPFHNFH